MTPRYASSFLSAELWKRFDEFIAVRPMDTATHEVILGLQAEVNDAILCTIEIYSRVAFTAKEFLVSKNLCWQYY